MISIWYVCSFKITSFAKAQIPWGLLWSQDTKFQIDNLIYISFPYTHTFHNQIWGLRFGRICGKYIHVYPTACWCSCVARYPAIQYIPKSPKLTTFVPLNWPSWREKCMLVFVTSGLKEWPSSAQENLSIWLLAEANFVSHLSFAGILDDVLLATKLGGRALRIHRDWQVCHVELQRSESHMDSRLVFSQREERHVARHDCAKQTAEIRSRW